MKSPIFLLYILGAVGIAVLANSISTIWAKGTDKISIWLFLLVLISPFVYISFGIATSKIGLSLASGTIDSLLTITSVMVGLIIFQEWNRISAMQYLGLAFAITGTFLMLYFPKVTN